MPEVALPQGPLWYAEYTPTDPLYPPLLLLHGAAATHLDWPGVLRRFDGARIIAPDLPGHGRSTAPGRQRVEDYAADILALLDALALPQAILMGHSLGGGIAQTIALEHPDRVAGLVLVGTGAKLRVHPDIMNNILSNPDHVYDLITAWEWGDGVPGELPALGRRRMAMNDPQVVHGDFLACQAFDTLRRLEAITAPTLVIGGTADLMTPLKFSATLAEGIPNAELVTVEGGGHMVALEQPGLVLRAISAWLAEQFR